MKFDIKRLGSLKNDCVKGYDVTINIENDGLCKLEFVEKIISCIEGFKDCIIWIDSEKLNIKYSWQIWAFEDFNQYNYRFVIFDEKLNLLYEFDEMINRKDIVKVRNYLARDIDQVIKTYKEEVNK